MLEFAPIKPSRYPDDNNTSEYIYGGDDNAPCVVVNATEQQSHIPPRTLFRTSVAPVGYLTREAVRLDFEVVPPCNEGLAMDTAAASFARAAHGVHEEMIRAQNIIGGDTRVGLE